MRFEWDERKNKSNIAKHEVSFTQAEEVFEDPNAVYIPDEKHSEDEERFFVIGEDYNKLHLNVCHCDRNKNGDEVIRIISAWKATKKEIKLYYERGNIL